MIRSKQFACATVSNLKCGRIEAIFKRLAELIYPLAETIQILKSNAGLNKLFTEYICHPI